MFRVVPRQKPHSPAGSLSLFLRLSMHGELVRGGAVARFEAAFARYLGVRNAVAVSSARMGMYLLLRAFGVGPEDEVLVPSLTCPVIPNIVLAAGARPVFVDSDPDTFNMSVADARRCLSPRTRVILATHIEGAPCDIDAFRKIAREHGVRLIEDCAQALGAEAAGRKTGTFGDAALFSFAYGKQINTMGGGMVVTDDDGLAASLRDVAEGFRDRDAFTLGRRYLLQYGMDVFLRRLPFSLTVFPAILLSNLVENDIINAFFEDDGSVGDLDAYRVRFSNLQAAMGLARLGGLEADTAARRANAARITASCGARVRGQKEVPGSRSAYCYYSVAVSGRHRVKKRLLLRGVDTQDSWNRSCASLPQFAGRARPCPVADRLDRELLYVPVYPELTRREVDHIVEALNGVAP